MSVVAVLKTSPRPVVRDYHRVMNLAGYQNVVARDVDTALKVNISWHFFFPGQLHHAVAARGRHRRHEAGWLRR